MIQNFFKTKELPVRLPQELKKAVKELSKIHDKKDVVRQVYDIVTGKYYGRRLESFLNLKKIFEDDIDIIWGSKGFYQCTTLNYLIRVLLVGSGHFQERDIKQINTLIWFISPHQYLSVRISENKTIFVDPWSKAYGIKFGNYASGFHSGAVLKQS